MDIKAEITNLVKKIAGDKELLAKFKTDPKGAVTELIKEAIDDDALEAIIAGIKAKLAVDDAGDLLDKAKGLLGKLGADD